MSMEKQNGIRSSVIGKRNYPSLCSGSAVLHRVTAAAVAAWQWLFMGDPGTGERAATFYTLIDHCHRQGTDATAYLN